MKLNEGFINQTRKIRSVSHVSIFHNNTPRNKIEIRSQRQQRKFTKQDTKQPAEGATKLSKTKHYNNESPTHILPQAKII